MKLSKLLFSSLLSAGALLSLPFTACGSDSPDSPETPVVKPDPEPDDPEPEPSDEPGPPEGKPVYIPQEMRGMDLKKNTSKWYWGRTKYTDDVILFWADGFGDDLSKAPSLQGQNMKVDADNLLKKVQEFYEFYYKEMGFVKPGKTKADKYRMMVMLDYSLEGTAYGGTYDNTIGALWVAPNRVQDKNMNAVAHELGHSFQLQLIADGDGAAWGGSGFYEMASQWMLWNVNPLWTDEEYYHLQDFRKLTHKAYLHTDNIYHSPYVLEFWAEKHGMPIIAELFRNGKVGEDPVQTYKRVTNIDQEAFNDEMYGFYARLVNFDIDRVRDFTRDLVNSWSTQMVDAGDGWKRVAPKNAPENYGFNIISIDTPKAGETITVEFRGEAGYDGFYTKNKNKAGWRYGLVAIDSAGDEIYGEMKSDKEGKVEFKAPEGKSINRLWMVVMGAPTSHWKNIYYSQTQSDAQWPYSIKVTKK